MTYTPELSHLVVSISNSTTVPLAGAGTYAGIAENLDSFSEISINLYVQPAIATGTLFYEFSPDGSNWDMSAQLHVSNPDSFVPFPLRIILPWFRVRCINGNVPQTTMRLTTVYHRTGSKVLTRLQGQLAGSAEPTEVVHALCEPSIAARHLQLNTDRAVFGAAVQANRVTQLYARFDQPIARNPVVPTMSGGATITQANGQAVLATGSSTTSSASLESTRRVDYSPGNEIYIVFTARFTTPTHAGSYQRLGIYDDANGFFLGYSGITFGYTHRRLGVDSFFPRSTMWNGDPLDGSAHSRFTRNEVAEALDLTKYNIYRIRFGWLGSASVLLEIMAPDGHWVIGHTATAPNTLTTPHIISPVLPIRAEVGKVNADATNLELGTCSWNGGTTEDSSAFEKGELRGRQAFDANVQAQTTSALVRTVPPGKVSRVKSLLLSCTNTLAIIGQLLLRDGSSGAVKVPFLIPDRLSAVSPGVLSQTVSFDQPLEFSSSIYTEVIAGNLTYSLTVVGYDREA